MTYYKKNENTPKMSLPNLNRTQKDNLTQEVPRSQYYFNEGCLRKYPLNAFMRFAIEERPKIVKANPNWNLQEIAKELAKRYVALDQSQKEMYRELGQKEFEANSERLNGHSIRSMSNPTSSAMDVQICLEYKHTQCFLGLDALASFLLQLIGRQGPIKFNTCIVSHNIFLEKDLEEDEYNELLKRDQVQIGHFDQVITAEHCLYALQIIKQHAQMIDNDRSYYFQGIHISDDNEYYISWGS